MDTSGTTTSSTASCKNNIKKTIEIKVVLIHTITLHVPIRHYLHSFVPCSLLTHGITSFTRTS